MGATVKAEVQYVKQLPEGDVVLIEDRCLRMFPRCAELKRPTLDGIE